MPRLHHLVCKSQVTLPLPPDELAALWRAVHCCPARQQITGLLIYLPYGQYLHVLEGPESSLGTLLAEKLLGELHPHDGSIIAQGPWARRSFPDWSISFVTEDLSQPLPYFIPLQQLVTLLPRLAPNRPALVHRILEFIAPYVQEHSACVSDAD